MMIRERRTMSENASLVRVTSMMAANGVVLLKVLDVVQTMHWPLHRPAFIVAFFVLPPVAGLTAGFVQLGMIELQRFKAWQYWDKWLLRLCAVGAGAPLAVWICWIMGWLEKGIN